MDKELTRYAFMSHMQDYMKHLLKDPLNASTDEFLMSFGINGPVALKMLLKKSNPDDEFSSVVIRTEKIKDNGFDDNGKRNKDTFEISYKIPRKDFKKKLRNLYINLFESNIIEDSPLLNEGAWGYGVLDNDSALDHQNEFGKVALKVLVSKLNNSEDNDSLWANIGVLVDFLKKYKDDELQVTEEYNEAINSAIIALKNLLNSSFYSSWSQPSKFKSSANKILNDLSTYRYQENLLNVKEPQMMPGINECDCAGATTCDASNGQFLAKQPGLVRKKTMYITNEQAKYLKEATVTQNSGDYQYTVPLGDKNDDFYKEACDHKDIIKKSFKK